MKVFFWFFLAGSLILIPLFIYEMFQERKINFSAFLLIALLIYFYKQAFKKENTD